jgi:YgiT-type zinc finger domain-containing protein
MKNGQTTKSAMMGFWDQESCEYCHSPIVEKRVTLYRKIKGNYVLIENVPAGVCTHCGKRYYAANVLKLVCREREATLVRRSSPSIAGHPKWAASLLHFPSCLFVSLRGSLAFSWAQQPINSRTSETFCF